MEDGAYERVSRKPCRLCGRQFVPESLARHEQACSKLNKYDKKKKQFDSAKQRGGEGSDVSYRQIKAAQKKTVAPPKSNWRAKHADFINTVRAARGVTRAMERGDPLPPPPPPSINPDYVQCPYCSRRFNEKAAERHINFCKEQQSRLPNKPKGDPRAANKMATRLQYQPPKPKTRSPATGTDMMGSPGYSPAGGTSRAPPSRTPPSRTPAASKTPASRPGVGRTPQGASNGYGRQPATRGRSTTGYQDGKLINGFHRPSSCKNVSFTNGLPPTSKHQKQNEDSAMNDQVINGKELYPSHRKPSAPKTRLPLSGWISKDSANARTTELPLSPGRLKSDHNGTTDLSVVFEEEKGRYVWAKAVAHKRSEKKHASDHGDDLDTPGFEGSQGIILRTGRDGRAYNEAKKDIKNGMKNKSQYMSRRIVRSAGVTKGLETSPSSNMMYSGHLRDNESDYYSGGSDNEYHNINAHALSVMNHDHFGAPSHASAGAKFCHECGTKYPVANAKFCCECGIRRMGFT